MAGVTYYVALPFAMGDDGPVAPEAIECLSASAAILRAEHLSRKEGNIGAIAFSRTGDPSLGEFADAQILRVFGVASDLSALLGDLAVHYPLASKLEGRDGARLSSRGSGCQHVPLPFEGAKGGLHS
jgi:hypothetical protein